ncbi:MAG: hypothetical protein ACD_77C00438G0002 [uncultured bacterium]|nr:MAG: hypothetical protein ACD_77C00438G0002 [uncultured bacterium]HBY01808.1 DUF2238 domain-containing protein [Rikenellaceae bacterium]
MNRYWIMLVVFFAVFIWSAINPFDFGVWVMEVVPGVVALFLFGLTYRKFRFTDMAYVIIVVHCLILFVGGHYTYARVPLFDWIKEVFDTGRNSYDKLGHLLQGITPVLVAREFLIRKNILARGVWNSVAVVSFALAFSAFYEIIEWGVALVSIEEGQEFLGTQGYIWDTQADMFYALVGALLMILFSGLHNKEIDKLEKRLAE